MASFERDPALEYPLSPIMPEATPVLVPQPRSQNSEVSTASLVKHLAHELRQPLSTIESIAYYLAMILPKTECKAREQVEKLQQLVEQANLAVSDAIHSLQLCPRRISDVNLNEAICRICTEMLLEQGKQPQMSLAEPLPFVRTDAAQTDHLIRSLLALSMRVGVAESPVSIRTAADDGWVLLETCCVTREASREECYPAADPFRPPLSSGGGLALLSAQRIAREHGGRVEVQSGEKFVIRVILPESRSSSASA